MVVEFQTTPMLTVKDVATLLNVHVNTVRRWSDSNLIKSYRITRRGDRRFRQEDINGFLSRYDEFNSRKGRLTQPFSYTRNVIMSPRSVF
jgi:excisionase family DNA binding protein